MAQVPREIWLGYGSVSDWIRIDETVHYAPRPGQHPPRWAFPDKDTAVRWCMVREHATPWWPTCPDPCPDQGHQKRFRAIRPVAMWVAVPLRSELKIPASELESS